MKKSNQNQENNFVSYEEFKNWIQKNVSIPSYEDVKQLPNFVPKKNK